MNDTVVRLGGIEGVSFYAHMPFTLAEIDGLIDALLNTRHNAFNQRLFDRLSQVRDEIHRHLSEVGKIRYVLCAKKKGVYLGGAMGLGFWSKLDSVGQTHAITFESEGQALTHANSWEQKIRGVKAHPVQCSNGIWASSSECGQAGLHDWVKEESS